ncbi:putative mitochondrial protein [Apostasia shenzhenica]|uniref:Putative mitochondrial protein n=1 Tax=Apostasia shenzhenica TaxID=1088818 RepID=A0A2I0A8T4_9ASPA|nr:putative mitochondrial protein [Apostasia shenzhenica]
MIGRAKKKAFLSIKDRISQRIEGWKERLLSIGGKEIMIKAIAQAIPTYAMSIFKLPTTLCKEIENIISRFWWRYSSKSKGIHWCQWNDLCKSKAEEGMGFRNLTLFNIALLGKQWWRLQQDQNSLTFRVLKGRYFPSGNLEEDYLGRDPSFVWRSIWEAKQVVDMGFIWRIGNGKSVKIWKDKWIPRRWSFRPFSPIKNLHEHTTVDALINPVIGQWNISLLVDNFFCEDVEAISNIPLGDLTSPDQKIWANHPSGRYSVHSAYNFIQDINTKLGVHIAVIKNSSLQGSASSSGGRCKSLAKSSSSYGELHTFFFQLFANFKLVEYLSLTWNVYYANQRMKLAYMC